MTNTFAQLDQLAGKRVLVTGGRGFIGSVLVAQLCDIGADVHSVGRSAPLSSDLGTAHSCDLVDEQATRRLFKQVKPDVVIHLASYVVGVREEQAVLPTLQSNLLSTVNLLSAALEQQCERVVLCGSLEEPEPSLEWQVPSSPYAASKLAASAYGRMYHALYDLSVVTLRVFMVYGPGQTDLKKLIPYTIRSISQGQTMEFTSGTREVDWIYVDDVANAFVTAAIAPDLGGKMIDVGTGRTISVRGVVELIHELMQANTKPVFGGAQDRQLEQIRVADVATSLSEMGWQPKYSLEDGMRLTIPAYTV